MGGLPGEKEVQTGLPEGMSECSVPPLGLLMICKRIKQAQGDGMGWDLLILKLSTG